MKEINFSDSFNSIIDVLPANIYWKDTSGRYLSCNKHMADMLGLPQEEIIGKTDYDLIGEEAEAIHRNDQMVIRNKTKHEIEETVDLKNATEPQIFLSTKTPVYDEDGKVTGILGISYNITERKRKEKEVADEVTRVIKMVSGCIAHEVRTPLSIINLNADMLQMKLNRSLAETEISEQNKIKKFVDNIKFGVKSGNNLISMLLLRLHSYFNKKANEESAEFEIGSIKHCINNAINEYPFYDSERELVVWDEKINNDFAYKGDDLFTKHVLFNLIKNALRSIREVERGKIYISLRQDQNCNYLIFKDTASGIPPEAIETIFEQFNPHSKEGTGLGLAFCKITMQSYDGDIICQSKEGEYTEFALKFPAIEVDA